MSGLAIITNMSMTLLSHSSDSSAILIVISYLPYENTGKIPLNRINYFKIFSGFKKGLAIIQKFYAE